MKRFQTDLGPLTELLFPSEREKEGSFNFREGALRVSHTALCPLIQKHAEEEKTLLRDTEAKAD